MAEQTSNATLSLYQNAWNAERKVYQKNVNRRGKTSFLRGVLLTAFVAMMIPAIKFSGDGCVWLIFAAVLFIAFIVAIGFHDLLGRKLGVSRLLMAVHQQSIARCKRDWSQVIATPYDVEDEFESVDVDLDLFGPESLFALLCTAKTPHGIQELGDWIVYPATPEVIKVRQIAVDELRPMHELRIDFEMRCAQVASSLARPSQFISWSEDENWIGDRPWLLWLCRLTAVTSLLAIVLLVLGVVPIFIGGPMLLVSMSVNFLLMVFYAGSIHQIFNKISSHQNEISHYRSLFQQVNCFESKSSFINDIQNDLVGEDESVLRSVDSLHTWTNLANLHRGFGMLAFLGLEFLFMWDVHVLHQLEKWKADHGWKARRWFEALGRWEAILALSKLAFDHPDWQFPVVAAPPDKSSVKLTADSIAHPLMDSTKVSNDVSVGPTGSVLLISGSNMSGKSTLLRSVGINSILAQMGSVVCANKLTMPPIRVATSMRIVDSLASGTSFFVAELKRLKQIVDLSREVKQNQTLLFLLDEILQGTNSSERQIAVSRVVESLIEQGAIGAISTHDLELASTDELKDACVLVYFSEQFETVDGESQMTFDYKIQNGIAPTTNALKLLEMVGLGSENLRPKKRLN